MEVRESEKEQTDRAGMEPKTCHGESEASRKTKWTGSESLIKKWKYGGVG